MKIAYIGTYPPRECGIGTFTQNLYHSMVMHETSKKGSADSFIVAMDDHDQTYNYPKEVKTSIRQEHQRDYLEAVKFINVSGANICILEHEFGIYGGEDGTYILPLLYRLEIPLIVTLHTILKTPSDHQKQVLQEICQLADKVVVMSHKAIKFLTTIYQVKPEKIEYIEHGVPDIHYDQEKSKKEFKLENRKLLLTFGFISRNKGIETAIKALPLAVKKHPDILYMILGKTHPNVIRESGEEYRIYLQRLVHSLNLDKHVLFLNEYVDQKELFKYLSASDIYVTPYLNEAQITSGTLAYAIGAGSAVISTPYWHASELLAEGRGRIFDFHDSEGLSKIIMELLEKPEELKKLRKTAYHHGRSITWAKSGAKHMALAQKILASRPKVKPVKETTIDPQMLPPFSLLHIKHLTDDTGIIQHAKYGIPNLKEGYCLDDNARALLMVLMTYRQKKDPFALELAPIYLSYIHYMQREDGWFRNFLSFSRQFLDETGSEDSFGRTIWALGYLLGNAPNNAYYQSGKLIFFNASQNFEKIQSIRGIANTMIGICYYLKSNPGDEQMMGILKNLSHKLIRHFKTNSTPDWKWFEGLLAYDNGILPLALLHAAEILKEDQVLETAMETMNFLTEKTLENGYLSIIGNKKWYKKDGERSIFAQQPIDALAMILMFHQAFQLTGDKKYLTHLFTSFMWFLGENDIRAKLFDFETKGCYDGFEKQGVNQNQGAESSLAYLISHLIVLQAFEKYEK